VWALSLYEGCEGQVGAKSELQACARTSKRCGTLTVPRLISTPPVIFAILRSPNPFLLSSMEPLTWVLLSTFVPPTLSTFAPLRVQRYLPGIYSYSASDLQSEHRGGCVLGSTNGCRVGPPRNVGGRQANMRQARRHSFCGAIADINRQFYRSSSHDTPRVRLAWFRLRKVHSDGSMHILNGGEQVRQPVLQQAFPWLLR
jgi:hypothetical protein